MEPSKDIISVRLAKLNNQFLGRSVGTKTNALKRALHRDGLLDALSVLYEECNNENLKKGDAQISKFVDKYRTVLTELRQLRVNIADFEVKDIIGRGHFGEVHIVKEKQTGDIYAMKTIKKETTLKYKDLSFYEEERDIMANNRSLWLVSLQYAFQDTSQLYLVMDFCPGGDLGGLLERKGSLSESDAIHYIAEVIMALQVLHSLGFVHRDLKPDNLLIDRCGHLKLGDFGSAARVPLNGQVASPVPIGTPHYIAPEILKSLEDSNKYPHGIPCDFWSLGVVMFELVCGLTPFVGRSVGIVYAAILNHKGGTSTNTHNSLQWPSSSGNDCITTQPTAQYKDVVCRLLHPVPERRLKHQQLLRHQLFARIQWNTLRDQTPPFVPIVKTEGDSSNFSKPEKQQHTPSVSSLRTRPHFTGKNLPFIGFTYAPDVLSYPTPSGGGGDVDTFTTDTEKSSESDSAEGFLNSSLNSTAICLSSFREMEKLLESRKKEIELLHKRVAAAESQRAAVAERGRQVDELEKQRAKLEEQLNDMACYNQKLQRQIESEHDERKTIESKSLDAIKSAKIAWQDKHQRQLATLERQKKDCEQQYRMQIQKFEGKIPKLATQLKITQDDLKKANREIDALKVLQKNHKDSMAKARRITRQSFFDPNTSSCVPSNSTDEQIQQLKTDHKRLMENLKDAHKEEIDSLMKRHLEEYKRLQKLVDEARDREQNLRVELEERMKDYSDLQIECLHLPLLRQKVVELEEHSSYLLERGSMKLVQDRDKYIQLCTERDTLQRTVENLEFNVCSLETDVMEKDEQILKLESDKDALTIRLNSANQKEGKYRHKVAELEDLLSKLQEEVTGLEADKSAKESSTKVGGTTSTTSEKLSFLEERIQTLEKQLKDAHEEGILLKQETRSAKSALWKKEKELADVDLDKRIATRELKQAEEKLKCAEDEKFKMTEKHGNCVKELKEAILKKDEAVAKLSLELTALTENIEKCEGKLKECQSKVESETLAHDRAVQELDRSKNDVNRLKAELQYSENRRLKAESVGETYRQEARESADERRTAREDRQILQDLVHTKDLEIQLLNQNYKLLQEASNMMEEQLVDFERLTEMQESSNTQLKEELETLRKEMDDVRSELCSSHGEMEALKSDVDTESEKLEQSIKQLRQQQERNLDLEKQLDELLVRECSLQTELESKFESQEKTSSKISKLENETALLKGQCSALKEEASDLRTQLAHAKEDSLRAQHELSESRERNNILHGLIEELEAQTVHWKQRELKAEATIHQHLKLIDFLQAKVEEAGRKKKTFSDMLFGSKCKENLPPSQNATPMKDHKANKELREQVTELRQKLESVRGSAVKSIDTVDSLATPRKQQQQQTPMRSTSNNIFATPVRAPTTPSLLKRKESETGVTPLMEGWVKIEKDGLLARVYLELRGSRLRWRNETSSNASFKGEVSVKNAVLHKELSKDVVRNILLSDSELANGFLIKLNTFRLLVVCPSSTQRNDWLTSFSEAGCIDAAATVNSVDSDSAISGVDSTTTSFSVRSQLWGRQLINVEQSKLKYLRCIVEIDEDTLLIGSDGGMFSWLRNRNDVVKIASWEHGVHSVTIAPELDVCVLLFSPAHAPVCVSLRQLKAVLKALPTTKPQLHPTYIPIGLQSKESCNVVKICPTRSLLFVGTSQQLHILSHVLKNQSFAPLHRINIQHGILSLLITPHTLLVAAQTVFEVDLKSYNMEDFLDPSDHSISHAVYGIKNKIYPLSILKIKDALNDGDAEYLVCYRDFGIFVDSYGQRSRSEDVLWKNLPLDFVYRKPFLFSFHATFICVMEIQDKSFKKNKNNEDDNLSVSAASSFSLLDTDRAIIDLKSANFVGKSSAKGSIYISVDEYNKWTQIIELCGKELFKKELGVSIETLDTIDDNDSCKNVLIAGETSESAKVESVLSDNDSIIINTDFASHIRQKAKLFHTMKNERNKVQAIQDLLMGKKEESSIDTDESDTSSNGSERNVIVHRSGSKNDFNGMKQSNSASSDGSKKVRFN